MATPRSNNTYHRCTPKNQQQNTTHKPPKTADKKVSTNLSNAQHFECKHSEFDNEETLYNSEKNLTNVERNDNDFELFPNNQNINRIHHNSPRSTKSRIMPPPSNAPKISN